MNEFITPSPRLAMLRRLQQDRITCAACAGRGRVQGRFFDGELWEEDCPVCDGRGWIKTEEAKR